MSGLGGLNKSPNGVVIGLVQLQLPVVGDAGRPRAADREDRRHGRPRRAARSPSHGPGGVPRILAARPVDGHQPGDHVSTRDGPEVAAFRRACRDNAIWGCFSIMERNPAAIPTTPGSSSTTRAKCKLYYRKLHPWVPVEPWEPGDLGIPVCDGPKGARIGLIICHDGMFPEMARECAYKGAEIMIRTAGYTAPIRHAWRITNQANAFCNLMADRQRLHVRLATARSTRWARRCSAISTAR